jgi:hypothetical protein
MIADEIGDIRIKDQFVKNMIADVQRMRGDKTATKTAIALIRERVSQIETLGTKAMGQRQKASA